MEQNHNPQYVLKIDARAYSTALTIARLADRQECMFLLLGEAGANVVRYILLLPGQQVTPCSCNITARSMSAAIDEIEQLNAGRGVKWVVLGWGHSHGHLSPFHSGTDISTSDDILSQIGFANRWIVEEPLSVWIADEGNLVVSLGAAGDEVVLHVGDPALAHHLATRELQAVRRTAVGFAYSLVVNARGDTYAEVITQPTCAPGEQARAQRHPAEVQVIAEPLDETALRQEIESKLHIIVVQPLEQGAVGSRPSLGLTNWCQAAVRRLDQRRSGVGGERHD